MSKSWYGHHIETIKGTDYVEYKDYLELDKKIDKQKEVLDKIKEEIKKYKYTDSWGDTVVLAKYLEDILEEIE